MADDKFEEEVLDRLDRHDLEFKKTQVDLNMIHRQLGDQTNMMADMQCQMNHMNTKIDNLEHSSKRMENKLVKHDAQLLDINGKLDFICAHIRSTLIEDDS